MFLRFFHHVVYITAFISRLLLCLALIRWGASQDQILFFAMSQLIGPSPQKNWNYGNSTKEKVLFWSVEFSGQSTLHTKHNLEKKSTSPHPQAKKKGATLHFMARFSLVATIFGLNSPPSHVQLFHITFLWHGSTTWEPCVFYHLLFQWRH